MLLTLFDPQRQLILRAHGPEVGPSFYVIKLKFQYCEWPGPLSSDGFEGEAKGPSTFIHEEKPAGAGASRSRRESGGVSQPAVVVVVAFAGTRLIYKAWPKMLQN